MKIATISSGFLPVVDGVTITVFNRIKKLSQLGHQVLLLCPDYSGLSEIYPNWNAYTGDILPGVRVVNLDSTSFMGVDFERNVSPKSYQTVLRELEKFRPDIIHVDEPERLWLGFLSVPGIDFSRKTNTPCVSFFHTNLIEYLEDYLPFPSPIIRTIQFLLRFHFRWTYNFYDATLTASHSSAEKLKKVGLKNVICDDFLGIDLDSFDPEKRTQNYFEKTHGLPEIDSRIKLIFVGRLTRDKGWKFAIDALPELQKAINFENIAFLIVGDGELKDEIALKFKALTSNIHFFGRLDPPQVAEFLANSDIHITASEKETRGLTVLESFASGIPVLAPDSGGVVDSVESGKNGFLYHPGDVGDFVQKLKMLVENPELRTEMGRRARATVADCSWDAAVQNLLKIWTDCIDKKPQKRRS